VKAVREKATGLKYALKIVNKKAASIEMESLEREISIMRVISHPNVISLKVFLVYYRMSLDKDTIKKMLQDELLNCVFLFFLFMLF
jgi:serine/threonine protein kinase